MSFGSGLSRREYTAFDEIFRLGLWRDLRESRYRIESCGTGRFIETRLNRSNLQKIHAISFGREGAEVWNNRANRRVIAIERRKPPHPKVIAQTCAPNIGGAPYGAPCKKDGPVTVINRQDPELHLIHKSSVIHTSRLAILKCETDAHDQQLLNSLDRHQLSLDFH